jgi:hypothetical protein
MKAVDLKREKFCHRKRCMIKNQLFNIVVKGQCHRVLLLKCNTTHVLIYIYIYIQNKKALALKTKQFCSNQNCVYTQTTSIPLNFVVWYNKTKINKGHKHDCWLVLREVRGLRSYSETCLNRTLNKLKSCINRTLN